MKKVFIETYGCQMNVDDSLRMSRSLQPLNYEPTEVPEEADLIVINTCSVRERASHKAHSAIGRYRIQKEMRPGTLLGITGCQAQAEGKSLLKRFRYLDFVLGPDQIGNLSEIVAELEAGRTRSVDATARIKPQDFSFVDLSLKGRETLRSAFVTIMKGCDNFCSFCIVPFVRGREVSRPSSEIIEEIRSLSEHGVQEVTLLGQNVNSYGTKRSDDVSFARLLQKIANETPIRRIRFTTSHPKDVHEDLMKAFEIIPALARHIHLPVQSGSNEVLKRMYRTYTREEYLAIVEGLRTQCPDIAITTDFIVGFPGETDRDFDETLSLIEQVQFDAAYSFVYSPRPHTTAGRYFTDDVPNEVKEDRLRLLQTRQSEITFSHHQQCVGKEYEILLEGPSRIGETFQGRTTHFRIVHLSGLNPAQPGDWIKVKIARATPTALIGEAS